MRIGILTSWGAHNYGALLQAWALMTFLQREGHEVVFLDTVLGTKHIRPIWKTMLSFSMTTIRRDLQNRADHSIAAFSSSFPSTPPLHSWKRLVKGTKAFDAVIVGSDQMWNPHWVLPWIPLVFLDFCSPECRRISYAASFGVPEWRFGKRDEVARLLLKFHAVSLRERSGRDIVEHLAPAISPRTVLDPTLLLDGGDYKNLFSVPSSRVDSARGSVFSYFLPATPRREAFDWTQSVKAAFNDFPEVLGVETSVRSPLLSLGCRVLGIYGKISVPEWLGRIASARFVVTNSFHGTVFSILFRRPFATILLHSTKAGRDMNERILSLLPVLGLDSRILRSGDAFRVPSLVSSEIDWEDVHKKLYSLRDQSISFLRTALSKSSSHSPGGLIDR